MLKDIPFQDVIIPSYFLKVVYLGLIMTINVVMELITMIYVKITTRKNQVPKHCKN